MKYDVCVFGSCAIDNFFYQKEDKTYNQEPDIISFGGKGANQAVAAAKAGAKVAIISKVNINSTDIINNLKKYNIDTFIEQVPIQNDYSNIYIDLNKDNHIERYTTMSNTFTKNIIEKYQNVILNSKIIVCQLKVPLEVTKELIDFCYKNNKMIILTPCKPEKIINQKDLIDKLTIITCNKKECKKLFSTDDISSCVEKYPNKLIVTLGKDGLIYHDGTELIKIPAIETEVIDTTGAGDTLNGNLCAFLAINMPLKQALQKAIHAPAMKLTKKTAQAGMPYLEELEKFIYEKNKR